MSEREAVYEALLAYRKNPETIGASDAILNRFASEEHAKRSFVKKLYTGVVEEEILLDAVLDHFLKKPIRKSDTRARILLEMGAFQMLSMAVPDAAACDECVKLARRKGLSGLSGFLNGVLRALARAKESGEVEKLIASFPIEVQASIPQWIADLWRKAYGEETAKALILAQKEEAPVTLRLMPNVTKEERDTVIRSVQEKGGEVTEGVLFPEVLRIRHAGDLREIYGYEEGLFAVQDEGAVLVTRAMGLQGQETVLDVCAAPGGKTLHAAALLPKGRVIACDVSSKKTDRIRENAKRLGIRNVEILERDATKDDPALHEIADVLLRDLPCSGLGVLTKKRDRKMRVREEDLSSLVSLQKKILQNVIRYLKPGGILVYSTCTLNPSENEEMAEFCENTLSLKPDAFPEEEPFRTLCKESGKDHFLQLFPHRHHTDGFFAARFRKEG